MNNIKQGKYIDFLLISVLFLIIFLTNLPLANTELMQPDGSGYLDMGRNLFSSKGAVISYNLNQYWPGKYYPFLPYIQPLYGIIAGLIWLLFGLKAVIGFNILLLAINCVLLYKIIKLYSDSVTSFLIALFIGFSKDIIFPAIAPLTEHLHLFFLLLSIFIYLRYKNTHFLVGILLAISCLVRASSFYNVLAFVIAIVILKGFSKAALKEYFKLTFGFLIIILSYEMFCYIKYGVFYPEYLVAAKIYRSAEIYSGAFYTDGIPVLNMPPLKLGMDVIIVNIRNNFLGFIEVFRHIKFVLFLAPLYFIFDLIKRRTPLLIIFFFQGACVLLGYTLSQTWSPIYEFSRFSVIPIITLGSIGFLSLKEIVSRFFSKTVEKRFPAIFIIIISIFLYFGIIFLYFGIKDYLLFRNHWRNIYPQEVMAYRENRDEVYEWIRTNTSKDALIASDFLADSFLFERPFISLPPGKALIAKNMNDFLKIYRPEYVLTSNKAVVNYLKNMGLKEKKRSGILILLKK